MKNLSLTRSKPSNSSNLTLANHPHPTPKIPIHHLSPQNTTMSACINSTPPLTELEKGLDQVQSFCIEIVYKEGRGSEDRSSQVVECT
jgi:hypothetical protein